MAFKKFRKMKVYNVKDYKYKDTLTIILKGEWLKETDFDTETIESIEGQLFFFDEADALYNPLMQEPDPEDVLPRQAKKKKAKGQREEDLKDFPEDIIPAHTVSKEALDAFYGAGN